MSLLCQILWMGTRHYKEIYRYQRHLQLQRIQGNIPDTLLLLEHYPVITMGCHGDEKDILCSKTQLENQGIALYKVNRGGSVTYHGPGQLVGYPILNLANLGGDLHFYMSSLEQMVINILAKLHITGNILQGAPGVWVCYEKIASIGLSVRNMVSMHGFALNVCPNLEHFKLIKVCGMTDCRLTSIKECIGGPAHMHNIVQITIEEFKKILITIMTYDKEPL